MSVVRRDPAPGSGVTEQTLDDTRLTFLSFRAADDASDQDYRCDISPTAVDAKVALALSMGHDTILIQRASRT